MIATRSRDRLAFLIAAAVALLSSPILAIWSLVVGSALACVGAALMIPSGTRAGSRLLLAIAVGVVVGAAPYVIAGLLMNYL